MSPQQIAEARRLADALTEVEAVMMRDGYMSPPILDAADLLRTLAAQAAQERPAVDVEALRVYALRALIAWDGTVLPKAHDGMMQERMEDLRAALEGLK